MRKKINTSRIKKIACRCAGDQSAPVDPHAQSESSHARYIGPREPVSGCRLLFGIWYTPVPGFWQKTILGASTRAKHVATTF